MRLRDVARCDRCAFWFSGGGIEVVMGQCRKRPPGRDAEKRHDRARRDYWCGEFIADEVSDGASA